MYTSNLHFSLSLSLRRDALKNWKQKQGAKATYDCLINVFKAAKRLDLADFVMEMISGTIYSFAGSRK